MGGGQGWQHQQSQLPLLCCCLAGLAGYWRGTFCRRPTSGPSLPISFCQALSIGWLTKPAALSFCGRSGQAAGCWEGQGRQHTGGGEGRQCHDHRRVRMGNTPMIALPDLQANISHTHYAPPLRDTPAPTHSHAHRTCAVSISSARLCTCSRIWATVSSAQSMRVTCLFSYSISTKGSPLTLQAGGMGRRTSVGSRVETRERWFRASAAASA